MAKRLHPVTGPTGLVVARGWAADPETLEGLTGPVDPAFLLSLPRALSTADLALVVAVTALLTMGRDRCRASALARACGLGPKTLPMALARLARWVPSLSARAEGEDVVLAAAVKRRLRPDFYVRLKVAVVAKAPSPAHARFYALAAWAAAGDEGAGRAHATARLDLLCLARAPDPAAEAEALLAWAQPHFGDARKGKVLSLEPADGAVTVRAVSTCHWNYDHTVAPRPWIGRGDGKDARISVLDGSWEGVDLSVSWLRVAKVCEWAARNGCAMDPAEIVAGWLVALRAALAGNEVADALSGRRLLDALARHGAARAFEAFVLDAAGRAARNGGQCAWPWLTQAARAGAEDARVLRRMAMRDPGDPRLKVHARCGETGEEFTAAQFSRLVRRTMAHLRAAGATRAEYAQTWRRLQLAYRGGRRPTPRQAGAGGARVDREAVGAEIMVAQSLAPEARRAAYDAALAVVAEPSAFRNGAPCEGVDAGLSALRWGAAGVRGGPETPRWQGHRRDWARANPGQGGDELQAAARDVLLDAIGKGGGALLAA